MTDHLQVALDAARAAGQLLRDNFNSTKSVNAFEAYDIKLELDVRTQKLIEDLILGRFPDHAIYGEEGLAGNQDSEFQWIVDPIDGTVNYFYGIPHFCISIAMRKGDEMQLGVIYDPMRDELWQTERGGSPTLNGIPCRVSPRTELKDAIMTIGFSKSASTINAGLPLLERMVSRVRKCRMMGSAALDLAYISCGRLDAYIEQAVSLWDIAAGQLLIEMAGGKVEVTEAASRKDKISVVASSGNLDLELE